MPEPRWLDREAAAEYVSLRVDELPRAVKAGKLPAPSYHLGPKTPRWDRLAIDRAFGVSSEAEAQDAAVQDAIRKIREGQGQGRSAHAR